MRIISFLVFLFAWPVMADPWHPEVGDPMRQTLLNAIRPAAEEVLGPPVVFDVIEMLVEGDRAFARLYAERPHGVAIDLEATPLIIDEGLSLDMFDGPRFEVFYHRQNGEWAVVTWEIGATDAWWFGYDCANYGVFYPPEAC